MSELTAGKIYTLEVVREAPFGYFLSNGKEDVLLHKNETLEGFDKNKPQGVFIYTDHQGRLAATMILPKIQIGSYGWVEVVDVHHRYGVFVSIGIHKDILVSKDDLPDDHDIWPTKGDRLYCTLKVDKKGRLFSDIAHNEKVEELKVPAKEEDFNKNITGTVYRLLSVGAYIFTDEGFVGFNHESERNKDLRLGERVSGRIIKVKEDGTVNLSLVKRAHEALDDDAEKVLAYLENRGGAMPYWDKSSPDIIQKKFEMSKAAFKRALGHLMKAGKVYQEEGWTYLKRES
ncbi:MAG: S1 RNA-binding domain-containing protein [Tuberibacillus sp.]